MTDIAHPNSIAVPTAMLKAAPDLLAALQEFVGAVDAGAKFADVSVVVYARTAIAKAKGANDHE